MRLSGLRLVRLVWRLYNRRQGVEFPSLLLFQRQCLLATEIEAAQAFLATLKATELGDAMDADRAAPTRDSEAKT